MAKSIIHKAESRGDANHGWLHSRHTFSFAGYHNPERKHFGALRVLNDDYVVPGMGFDTHPHNNMEIISIPLEGDLEHKDSMGNVTVIKNGDVQVMSAGTGVSHSEYNHNSHAPVKFLQIWVFPNQKNVPPRYDQITLDPTKRKNKLQQIVSPDANDEGVWIHQNAWFHLGTFEQNNRAEYLLKQKGNGVYAFVLKGGFTVGETVLNERDGMGIWEADSITIHANENNSEILLMEIPMSF